MLPTSPAAWGLRPVTPSPCSGILPAIGTQRRPSTQRPHSAITYVLLGLPSLAFNCETLPYEDKKKKSWVNVIVSPKYKIASQLYVSPGGGGLRHRGHLPGRGGRLSCPVLRAQEFSPG